MNLSQHLLLLLLLFHAHFYLQEGNDKVPLNIQHQERIEWILPEGVDFLFEQFQFHDLQIELYVIDD